MGYLLDTEAEQNDMKRTVQAVLVAVALSAPAFAPVAARADVSVTFDPGGVAYGYQDGYWDRGHHWHGWPNAAAAREWRERNHEHYYDRRHDRERGEGWRGDSWWEHH
jgi:hypothetical protein